MAVMRSQWLTSPWQQVAVLGGNVLEWYEFSLYGFLSAIFAHVFFPNKSTFVSLVMTFGAMALAYITRPIGGLVLGYFGDRYGRRRLLVFSSVVTSVVTLAMGLLPDYQHIGIAAPIILTLLRLLYSFVISSELTGATLYQLEHGSNGHNRNFLATLVQSGMFLGGLLASLSVLLLSLALGQHYLIHGGWRIPYVLAALVGGVISLLRWHLPAMPSPSQDKISWRPLLKDWPQMVRGFCLPAAATAGIYIFIYQINYITHLLKQGYSQAMVITLLCQLLLVICLPLFGKLANRMGLQRQTQWGVLLLLLTALPLFYLMSREQLTLVLLGQLLFVVVLSPYFSINTAAVAVLFPTHYRYTLTAFILNLSITVFGATTPLVFLLLFHYSGNLFIAGIYFLLLCLLVLLANRANPKRADYRYNSNTPRELG